MADFLLEIGTEEIPAAYLDPALEEMREIFREMLRENRLDAKEIKTVGTPRRLVLYATNLPFQQPDQIKEIIGPRESIAFTSSGEPTPALHGFAKRYNVSPSQIKLKDSEKGKVCYIQVKEKGERTEVILARLIPLLVRKISFPKLMRWGVSDLTFARPIRYLVALFNKRVLKVTLGDIKATNHTYGHHILSPQSISLVSANFLRYQKQLERARVIVDPYQRRTKIATAIKEILDRYGGVFKDEFLLNEVTNLVEYPVALECDFDPQFLSLPQPVLEAAMKSHQKYFPVYNQEGKLYPKFIVITNGGTNLKLIKEGHERVLQARLYDAAFFFQNDKEIKLDKLVDRLKEISFLGQLGSYRDKADRLQLLGEFILSNLAFPEQCRDIIRRASLLAKVDLLTEMVGEFPELQGVMGCEYARLQGEAEEVCQAIREHYLPRYHADDLPQTPAGIILALAEKFDNLSACFILGLKPTGNEDPYALRRQSLGIIRIIFQHNLPISLRKTILYSLEQITKTIKSMSDSSNRLELKSVVEYADEIINFFQERLHQLCLDEKYPYDLVRAVLSSGFDKLADFKLRLESLVKLSQEDFWPKLVTLVERTYNISRPCSIVGEVNPALFQENEERLLWEIYTQNRDVLKQLIDQKRYREASQRYTELFAEPVHRFFEKVFVNVEDSALRNNRLLLLKNINRLYSDSIADLSQIVTEITKRRL